MIEENLTKKKRESKVYADKKFVEMNPGLKLDAERCMRTLYSTVYADPCNRREAIFS